MSVRVYKTDASPPSRALMMGCGLFQVPAEMHDVNLRAKEQHAPDYLQINPLHTVPTFQDGELTIIDSHAALKYIALKYGKDDSWYPRDIQQQAAVDEILFFDASNLFPRARNVAFAILVKEAKSLPQEYFDAIEEAYGFVEGFLSRRGYMAGPQLTIADIAVFATITSYEHILPRDAKKYPKTGAWLKELSAQPWAKQYNEPGLQQLGAMLREKVQAALRH